MKTDCGSRLPLAVHVHDIVWHIAVSLLNAHRTIGGSLAHLHGDLRLVDNPQLRKIVTNEDGETPLNGVSRVQ
eukprot:COSAG05_NODE_367_length_10739_cov_10.311842_11_plen_73_part_00